MNILLIGASGMIGSRVAAEAANRGHEVTGVTRSGKDGTQAADAADVAAITALAKGKDAVVLSIAPPRDGSEPEAPLLAAGRAVLTALRAAGVDRLVVVGGAGSLEIAPGTRLVDTPDFPEIYKKESLSQAALLDVIRAEADDLRWTYISPAAEIAPGERTGAYRKGGDALVGPFITAEDYAVALVDELENPTTPSQRINVAH
ncbi:NAD(P)-dependent oxidoreductase [Nonomuraea endophytica]|uniref:NAD(P)-dependent oxidoreductase n=1 Tax=Nonomuraea endophytica TaxID=714136 RepID=UPI0037CA7685